MLSQWQQEEEDDGNCWFRWIQEPHLCCSHAVSKHLRGAAPESSDAALTEAAVHPPDTKVRIRCLQTLHLCAGYFMTHRTQTLARCSAERFTSAHRCSAGRDVCWLLLGVALRLGIISI